MLNEGPNHPQEEFSVERPTFARVMAGLLLLGAAGCGGSDNAANDRNRDPIDPGTEPGDPPTWDDSTVEQTWRREGFHTWEPVLRAHDVDGDGNDEFVVGGRGVALFDGGTIQGGPPVWSLDWNHTEDPLTGGEWENAYQLYRFDGNGDGTVDILIVNTARDAYLVDGATGEQLWYRQLGAEFLPARGALYDADSDGVPDLFASGQSKVFSGKTGDEIFDTGLPLIVADAATAELDGQPGKDLVVAVELDGNIGDPPATERGNPSVFAYVGTERIWEFATVGLSGYIAAGDLDGDGRDETLVGTNWGWLYAISPEGEELWSHYFGEGSIIELIAGDTDGDGKAEVYASYLAYQDQTPTQIVKFAPDGTKAWNYAVQPVWAQALELAQLDSDPQLELLVGCGMQIQGWQLGFAAALDTDDVTTQRELWKIDMGVQVFDFEMIHRDGEDLVLIATDDGRVRAVEAATGRNKWTVALGSVITVVASGDVDGDGVDEVVRGDDRGNLMLSRTTDGTQIWARRLKGIDPAMVTGIAIADADGDGKGEVLVGGTLGNDPQNRGVIQLYAGDGALLWSKLVPGWINGMNAADLDGDGKAELLVVEDRGTCAVRAFSFDGSQLWLTTVSTCGMTALDFGDMDGDGTMEIAYAAAPLLDIPDIAVLSADGTLRWNKEVIDTGWVHAVPGGLIHGGGATNFGGFAAKVAVQDGSVIWEARVEGVPDPDNTGADPIGNPIYFGTLVPDQTGDDLEEVAVSSWLNELILVDGATGDRLWATNLFDKPIRQEMRPAGGPIVYVPGTDEAPGFIATAQAAEGHLRTRIFAFDVDGSALGTFDLDGAAYTSATARFPEGKAGAVFGSGFTLYAVEGMKKAQ